jgi:hypothetical protein
MQDYYMLQKFYYYKFILVHLFYSLTVIYNICYNYKLYNLLHIFELHIHKILKYSYEYNKFELQYGKIHQF